MKKTLILTAAVVALTGASLVYFLYVAPNRLAQPDQTGQEKGSAPAGLIAAPGLVEPVSEEIEVGAQVPGKLSEVTVEEGEQVLKGQVIAVIENADLRSAVETARAETATLRSARETARARLLEVEADRARIANAARPEERREARARFEETLPIVENAKREYERRQRLFATGDVSREDLDRARTALETAEKTSNTMLERFNVVNAGARADDLTKAEAAVRIAESQLREYDARIGEAASRVREAEARLEKTYVRAPIAGVVLRKRLKSGETYSPESPNGIVTLADTSVLRVRVDLDETDVARIREGQSAHVGAEAFGDKRFPARVIRIGQVLGRKNFRTERPVEKVDTKILEVILELDLEPGQTLPLGLRVDAFIESSE